MNWYNSHLNGIKKMLQVSSRDTCDGFEVIARYGLILLRLYGWLSSWWGPIDRMGYLIVFWDEPSLFWFITLVSDQNQNEEFEFSTQKYATSPTSCIQNLTCKWNNRCSNLNFIYTLLYVKFSLYGIRHAT